MSVIAFFVFAALLPPFVWYVRTPLLLGATALTFLVLFFVRASIVQARAMDAIISGDQGGS